MYCRKCGKAIPNGATECPYCHAKLNVNSGTGTNGDNERKRSESADTSEDTARKVSRVVRGGINMTEEAGKNVSEKANHIKNERTITNYATFTTPVSTSRKSGAYVLAEGEDVIRSYMCANLDTGIFGSGTAVGYLTVTNKRMMYEGSTKGSRVAMETPIDSVGAIQAYEGTNVNGGLLILGIVLGIMGLIMIPAGAASYSSVSIILGIALIAVAAAMIFASFRKSYMLNVSSNKAAGSAICIGEGPKSIQGNKAFFTIAAQPTADTYKMMYEIGAIVQDVQQLGDQAIEKWKQ